MNLPFQFPRLPTVSRRHDAELTTIGPRSDVQWGAPIFRAPALPWTLPMNCELPFVVNFGSKTKAAR